MDCIAVEVHRPTVRSGISIGELVCARWKCDCPTLTTTYVETACLDKQVRFCCPPPRDPVSCSPGSLSLREIRHDATPLALARLALARSADPGLHGGARRGRGSRRRRHRR